MFCNYLKWNLPVSGQKRTVSMKEGASRARVEELAAPTREMNRSSLGMAAARPTGTEETAKSVKKQGSIWKVPT